MSLGSDEINRLMTESVPGWGINTSLFCGTCGYNLRGLPYSGVCPECGHAYNASDHRLTGIFLPNAVPFPGSDFACSLLSFGMAGLLTLIALSDPGFFLLVIVFAGFGIAFAFLTWRKTRLFVRAQRILRRIEQEQS
ncbi:MAG: hypothetical protein JXB13_16810 [Phycisphaerae bacterium]|nr:hypothetical protein [Phycisphaerae bacterium]